MIFTAALIFPFACFMVAEALPPADEAPALQPNWFDFGNLPNDIIDEIGITDPRDIRSLSLAISTAEVPTKEINDHVKAIIGDKKWRRHYLDAGIIWTSQSPDIKHFKAIEEKLNPRTNKPFKFDTILVDEGWQDDPVWQSWDWTNVKEVYFPIHFVDPKHSKLPLTRLRGFKTITFNYAFAKPGYDVALDILEQNPAVEILKVSFNPIMPSQLAQTVCSLENLKELALLHSTDFVEEVLKCLPAIDKLEKLEIAYSQRARERIVVTPDIVANHHLNQLVCDGCDSSWADIPRNQKLTWVFDKDHDETVRVLKKLESMKVPLLYLRLKQYRELFEPEEFDLIRKIAPRVNEMEIFYYDFSSLSGERFLQELPDFRAGKSSGEYLKKRQAKYTEDH